MIQYVGRILEFHLEPDGRKSVLLSCPDKAAPSPGQFTLAVAPSDPDSLLAEPLYLQQKTESGFLAAPVEGPLSPFWRLGTDLALRGPLGKGFTPPANLRNLALIAAGSSAARLLPLLKSAENAALFTDLPVHGLPMHVEVQPLSAASEAVNWADFIAADIPLENIEALPNHVPMAGKLGQALITTEMPCGGIADCGICALTTHRKTTLLCLNGPVLSFEKLAPLFR